MSNLSQKIIESAIDEVNEDSEGGLLIDKDPSTTLLGYDSRVDSLALVRLLVTVERLVEEQTGKSIVIVDESAFEAEQSPFATVESLIRHIDSLLSVE
jgi:acyl carrier protein